MAATARERLPVRAFDSLDGTGEGDPGGHIHLVEDVVQVGLDEGADPLFGSYLRTPGETDLWQHVTTWFLPAQLARGVLIGLALSPFLPLLRRWTVAQRTVAVAGLYLVIGFWAAAVAAPGNIEGLVYLRPEFGLDVVVRVQPEIIIQGGAMSLIVALGLQRI